MYLLLCRSLTYAQRSQKLLERNGMTASIVKAPRDVAVNGCSYCLRIQPRIKDRALEMLDRNGLSPDHVFLLEEGRAPEVIK